MIDGDFAIQFATEWIDSWNKHNLEGVLSHYTDDFKISSPAIIQLQISPTGELQGKTQVATYWRKALELFPDLKFELISILNGVQSVTINYKGVRGRIVAEVFFFDDRKKVCQSFVYYQM